MLNYYYTIFISILFVFVSYGKSGDENYKVVYPQYIPVNSPFDVSLITTNSFPTADKLELFIIPDNHISLNKIELRSVLGSTKLNFAPASLEGFLGTVYKTSIQLDDSTLAPGLYFQILFNLKSDFYQSSILKLYGVFKKQDTTLGYLIPKSELERSSDNKTAAIKLQYYKPQKSAGKALQFLRNSILEIPFDNIKSKQLLTEFWVKLNDSKISFLKIFSKKQQDVFYQLLTNSFQMLSVSSNPAYQEYIYPFFTSRKSWYHIEVFSNFNKRIIYFYCNGNLFSKNKIPYSLEPNDLIFQFENLETDKSFSIDLLRLSDFHNSIDVSFANKNYLSFLSDSSSVLMQYNFDNPDNIALQKEKGDIYYTGTQLIKSDAPIFARAPELNIDLHSNSYELLWSGGDYKQASYYVLERSANNNEYEPIFTIQADNNVEKNYSFLDEKDETSEVVYYRVKQVNIDGSIVYSAQVKVGQGKIEPFIIEPNFPNPFNPKTTIVIELLVDTQIEVTVYNLEGREIQKLYKGFLSKGIHKFSFDGSELPSGIYLYKVETPAFTKTRKMILTK